MYSHTLTSDITNKIPVNVICIITPHYLCMVGFPLNSLL
jgi:hypothetical protein